ncbi:hypothetical protein FNV43_RR06304 [Rhamnella rubrinervis]|uniref:Uncharacterized protein n=1 Tax=Rhamnella rubrinervis TaxID=2594499 RepID=A0A8K0HEA0_9ROSA|nr:hypothetical protein FNV43_RR06304 [Rhamnella rubrinervis]
MESHSGEEMKRQKSTKPPSAWSELRIIPCSVGDGVALLAACSVGDGVALLNAVNDGLLEQQAALTLEISGGMGANLERVECEDSEACNLPPRKARNFLVRMVWLTCILSFMAVVTILTEVLKLDDEYGWIFLDKSLERGE